MDSLEANHRAHDIVANITNPGSFSYMIDFPGLDKLGFAEDEYTSNRAKNVGLVVHSALAAGRYWQNHGENSAPFGVIQTMLQFDIVSYADIDQALWKYRRANDPNVGD